jgi:hypothetical protein
MGLSLSMSECMSERMNERMSQRMRGRERESALQELQVGKHEHGRKHERA